MAAGWKKQRLTKKRTATEAERSLEEAFLTTIYKGTRILGKTVDTRATDGDTSVCHAQDGIEVSKKNTSPARERHWMKAC